MKRTRGAAQHERQSPAMSDVSTAVTATPTLAKSDLNLVWLDCEMSGLDPERERLLEIAVVVTSPDLACGWRAQCWWFTKAMPC